MASASRSYSAQSEYLHSAMERYSVSGVQEMRFAVLPYSASPNSSVKTIENCLQAGYAVENTTKMFSCWSSRSNYDNFPKSADFAVLQILT